MGSRKRSERKSERSLIFSLLCRNAGIKSIVVISGCSISLLP